MKVLSGRSTPSSRAAAKVMTFPTLPGSKTASTDRAVRSASAEAPGSPGSTERESARTRTLPVAGSMTTAAPQSAPWATTTLSMASWAMVCRFGSRVRRTVAPGLAGTSSCSPVGMIAPVLPISTEPSPLVPVRTSFWLISMPALPTSSRTSFS